MPELDPQEIWTALVGQLLAVAEASKAGQTEVAHLRLTLDLIVDILVARGALTPGHRQLVGRLSQRIRQATTPNVKLRVLKESKRTKSGADIDCASLIPLCEARCCTFEVELSLEDVEEGIVRWEIDQPYLLRHERGGYCHHFTSTGCNVYDARPMTCREYDCRDDPRVWIDFDKRIPRPLRRFGLTPPSENG